MRGKRNEREKERSSIHWLTPKLVTGPTPGQAEARHFIWVSHVCDRDPNTWSSFHCISQAVRLELDQKWSNQDMNRCPKEMPVS